MGIHTKSADDIQEVDVIIAGGKPTDHFSHLPPGCLG